MPDVFSGYFYIAKLPDATSVQMLSSPLRGCSNIFLYNCRTKAKVMATKSPPERVSNCGHLRHYLGAKEDVTDTYFNAKEA